MKILMIIPEDQFCPPTNGGSLRIYHLLRQLGLHHDVHVVTNQSAGSFDQIDSHWCLPTRVQVRSPIEEPPPWNCLSLLPARLAKALSYRWQRRSLAGPASSVFLSLAHLVEDILRSHRIDVVLFEHIEAMTLAALVKRIQPEALRILDAHNIDHRLVEQALLSRPQDTQLANEVTRLRWVESHLAEEVDTFIACSDDDRDTLIALNGGAIRGFTVPNGVDTQGLRFATRLDMDSGPFLLFCGSLDYLPNSEGLSWFIDQIWPILLKRHKRIRLSVVGRGAPPEELRQSMESDPQIDLVGQVVDVSPYYAKAHLSIVPLRMGSGTRLKVLEAMALGSPLVSTTIGIEGINCFPGTHSEIANDPIAFADSVTLLLDNPAHRQEIARAARHLVESFYDWRVVGATLCDVLTRIERTTAR